MFYNKKFWWSLFILLLALLAHRFDFNSHVRRSLSDNGQGRVAGVFDNRSDVAGVRVDFFNLGEADSALINLPGKYQVLIDGGELHGGILEKLSQAMPTGDERIELIVATHPHADHLGGLIDVLNKYQVGQVWLSGVAYSSKIYLEFLNLLKEKNISTRLVYSCGHSVDSPEYAVLDINNLKATDTARCLDELKINAQTNLKILFPLENLKGKKIKNVNNSSVVLKLNHQTTSFLFMGDAEQPAEEKILGAFSAKELKSDVIKVAHQGSSDASGLKFLKTVRPAYAVIFTGQHNPYGHPSLRIIRRLQRLGSVILRTDKNGDIEFVADQDQLKFKCAKGCP